MIRPDGRLITLSKLHLYPLNYIITHISRIGVVLKSICSSFLSKFATGILKLTAWLARMLGPFGKNFFCAFCWYPFQQSPRDLSLFTERLMLFYYFPCYFYLYFSCLSFPGEDDLFRQHLNNVALFHSPICWCFLLEQAVFWSFVRKKWCICLKAYV